MWIRSQNGRVLNNTEKIYIEYNKEIYNIEDDDFIYGEYSTEKKAIIVLDMIEKYIKEKLNIIFQMPQDNEVE